jgi:hypothetical protein
MGGRYYSPIMKSFISSCNFDEILYNIDVPGNLNAYSIGNPMYFPVNGYNIFTSIPFAWDPPSLTQWQSFWNSTYNWYNELHWGWKIGVGAGLFLAGLGLTALTGGLALPFIIKFGIGVGVGTAIGTGINLAIGAEFGDALLEGFADSVLMSGVFSFGSGAIRAGKYGYAYATKNAEIMAKLFTHNSHAASVMLGHSDSGAATGYVAQAKAGGHTYFKMLNRQWARLSARFGGDVGMWEINKAFLIQQIAKNQVFVFSHAVAWPGSFYAQELAFLLVQGII